MRTSGRGCGGPRFWHGGARPSSCTNVVQYGGAMITLLGMHDTRASVECNRVRQPAATCHLPPHTFRKVAACSELGHITARIASGGKSDGSTDVFVRGSYRRVVAAGSNGAPGRFAAAPRPAGRAMQRLRWSQLHPPARPASVPELPADVRELSPPAAARPGAPSQPLASCSPADSDGGPELLPLLQDGRLLRMHWLRL